MKVLGIHRPTYITQSPVQSYDVVYQCDKLMNVHMQTDSDIGVSILYLTVPAGFCLPGYLH